MATDNLREAIETRLASGGSLARRDELGVEDVIAQVQKIQAVMEHVMKKDEHYGVIPGTKKPTLLKPGAEKLLLTFRFDPQYESGETYDGKHLTVKSRCTLYHIASGLRMGSGEGSCSTKESKYAYRKGTRLCPKCGKETIIKGKAQYGGGWLCWQKQGGCGEKWKDGDPAIEGQSVERVPNEDLADEYNTVLKMANKRSLVAAVLNVTAASDIFTQDLEDQDIAGHGDTHSERVGGTGQGQRESARVGEPAHAPGDPSAPIGDPNAPGLVEESRALFADPREAQVREELLTRLRRFPPSRVLVLRRRLELDTDKDLALLGVDALELLARHLEAPK